MAIFFDSHCIKDIGIKFQNSVRHPEKKKIGNDEEAENLSATAYKISVAQRRHKKFHKKTKFEFITKTFALNSWQTAHCDTKPVEAKIEQIIGLQFFKRISVRNFYISETIKKISNSCSFEKNFTPNKYTLKITCEHFEKSPTEKVLTPRKK